VAYIYHLASTVDGAVAWPEIYAAATISAFILLISIAMFVALFDHDDKRANRAYKIFRDLLKVFQRRAR
jgi:hypothetical protein